VVIDLPRGSAIERTLITHAIESHAVDHRRR
jgi:hypothetical protein